MKKQKTQLDNFTKVIAHVGLKNPINSPMSLLYWDEFIKMYIISSCSLKGILDEFYDLSELGCNINTFMETIRGDMKIPITQNEMMNSLEDYYHGFLIHSKKA